MITYGLNATGKLPRQPEVSGANFPSHIGRNKRTIEQLQHTKDVINQVTQQCAGGNSNDDVY